MTKPLLEVKELSKHFRSNWTFRSIRAVQNVSFEVFPAESFGFIGHNGAGKTTTIRCIIGLIKANRGEILLNGERLCTSTQRSVIGFLPEQPYFYEHLTVQETMELFAVLHGIKSADRRTRIRRVLEMVSLADRAKSPVRVLSKGLQQRLGLAQAIVNEPKLLLLDEPFSGLDPLGRMEVRELLLGLKREGTTVFMSSHILSDVEEICDRVAIMARGELKRVFALCDVPRLFGESFELVVDVSADQSALIEKLKGLADEQKTAATSGGQICTFRFANYLRAHRGLADALSAGVRIVSFQNAGLSLEDVFVSITESARTSAAAAQNDHRNEEDQAGEL